MLREELRRNEECSRDARNVLGPVLADARSTFCTAGERSRKATDAHLWEAGDLGRRQRDVLRWEEGEDGEEVRGASRGILTVATPCARCFVGYDKALLVQSVTGGLGKFGIITNGTPSWVT